MKSNHSIPLGVLFLISVMILASCKKEEKKVDSQNEYRYEWVAGSWKQKDLAMGVDIKFAGQKIPAGTSVIALAPLIGQALGSPAIAQAIICTKDNIYSFNSDRGFSIEGCTDLILPGVGNSGKWDLTIYNAVLNLTSSDGKAHPNWINSITKTTMNLGITLSIPNVGDIPVVLMLEKQP